MVAHELEFSLNAGTSTGVVLSLSIVFIEVPAPLASAWPFSCKFVSSQLILNRVTRGSEARMFLIT